MKILVFSHKESWNSENSPTGWATDGGFSIHMDYLSSIFDEMTIVVPEVEPRSTGEVFYTNSKISILPINKYFGKGLQRKFKVLLWALRNYTSLKNLIKQFDAVHAPIPSDIGTVGMLLARHLKKPLYIRHCGNWFKQETLMERYWVRFMEKHAGGQNVFLATGGGNKLPSMTNNKIQWIFSSSMTSDEILVSPKTIEVEQSPIKIAIACRQTEKKGTRKVIQALKFNQTKYIEFHILGDGEDLENFISEATELNVLDSDNSKCIFYGKKNHNEVISILEQMNLFVFPTSSSEGFPKAVLEAMAMGLPIVTTNVSVLPKLVKNSGAGIIIEPYPEDIYHSIVEMVSDPRAYNKYSQSAINEASKYTLENWVKEIETRLRTSWECW